MRCILVAALRKCLESLRKCGILMTNLLEQVIHVLFGDGFATRRLPGLPGDRDSIESNLSDTARSRLGTFCGRRRGIEVDIDRVHCSDGVGIGGGVKLALFWGRIRRSLGLLLYDHLPWATATWAHIDTC